MTIKRIGIWNGNNLDELVAILSEIETNATIEAKGKKLIVEDEQVKYRCCFIIGDEVEIPSYKFRLLIIGVWYGDNFYGLIQEIIKINTEIKIRVRGKKLIAQDPNVNYYCCVSVGDSIEIPVYKNCFEVDEFPEPEPLPPPRVESEQSRQMMREWGLLPKKSKKK